MIYYIDYKNGNTNNAGKKAPDDIAVICKRNGYSQSILPEAIHIRGLYKYISKYVSKRWSKEFLNLVKSKDIIIYQHPSYGTQISGETFNKLKEKGCKLIALIHDINFLRQDIGGNKKVDGDEPEVVTLKKMDVVICHNDKMREYLVSREFDESKLISLEIFDYLTNYEPKVRIKSKNPTICIAGNLIKTKCKYIYDIINPELNINKGLTLNLYGSNFDETLTKPYINYKGSFKPDEIPSKLEGDFGLVWDGISIDTCTGITGEYLKYNNPHKTSLYLASGLPVIVWKKAAIAGFVLKNKVGIAVDNLKDLDTIISNISYKEYNELVNNVSKIGKKIREGYYFDTAIHKAIELVEE